MTRVGAAYYVGRCVSDAIQRDHAAAQEAGHPDMKKASTGRGEGTIEASEGDSDAPWE